MECAPGTSNALGGHATRLLLGHCSCVQLALAVEAGERRAAEAGPKSVDAPGQRAVPLMHHAFPGLRVCDLPHVLQSLAATRSYQHMSFCANF